MRGVLWLDHYCLKDVDIGNNDLKPLLDLKMLICRRLLRMVKTRLDMDKHVPIEKEAWHKKKRKTLLNTLNQIIFISLGT